MRRTRRPRRSASRASVFIRVDFPQPGPPLRMTRRRIDGSDCRASASERKPCGVFAPKKQESSKQKPPFHSDFVFPTSLCKLSGCVPQNPLDLGIAIFGAICYNSKIKIYPLRGE